MGTSKNFSTPKGGPWTPLKNDLTDHLAGDSDITPERLVGRAIAAAGVGLGGLRNSSGGGGTGGGGGRGNARGGGAGTPASRAVGGAVASLAGFGASVRAEGLDAALGASLQSFLDRDGIEGLIESFLTKCVYDGIWFTIEEHVGKKSETNSDVKTLASAIEGVCRAEVRVLMKESRGQGTFEKTDWFGSEGQTAAQVILRELDRRLRALEES